MLGWCDLFSVVSREAEPDVTQQKGRGHGMLVKFFAHNLALLQHHHKPPAGDTWKEETMLRWKSPLSLWGNAGSALRRKHLGQLCKLSDTKQQRKTAASVLDE